MVSMAFSNGDKVVWTESPSGTKSRDKEEGGKRNEKWDQNRTNEVKEEGFQGGLWERTKILVKGI